MKKYFVTWRQKISAVLAATLVLVTLAPGAYATGPLSNAKLTLGDPRPSSGATQNVTYTFNFTTGTSAVLKCITYDFWTTANGSVEPTGMITNGTTKGTFTGTGVVDGNWTVPGSPVEGTIKVTNTTGDTVNAATSVTTPFTVPRNPSTTGSFWIRVMTFTDTSCTTPSGGNDKLTIAATTVAGVTVSATIDPTLTFAVGGVGVSTVFKGALTTSANCADSAQAVTFGSAASPLSADTNYDCAQSLTTSTNAQGGYQVTITGRQTSGDFLKMNSDNTKSITNWTGTNATPTATATSGSSEQFAYTTSDAGLSGSATRFTTADNLFAGLTLTPDEVSYSASAVANKAVNVGLRLRFTGTTEAGVYSGTLTYTCTPTF